MSSAIPCSAAVPACAAQAHKSSSVLASSSGTVSVPAIRPRFEMMKAEGQLLLKWDSKVTANDERRMTNEQADAKKKKLHKWDSETSSLRVLEVR
jgi:hypothetical protein